MFAKVLGVSDSQSSSMFDPLGESSASYELGLLATRGLAAVRRHLAGEVLDAIDLDALSQIAGQLESSRQIVEFLTSGGEQGRGPNQASAWTFDMTLDAVIRSGRVELNSSLEEAFKTVASEIYEFIKVPSNPRAEILANFFALLIRAAAHQNTTTGETVLAL